MGREDALAGCVSPHRVLGLGHDVGTLCCGPAAAHYDRSIATASEPFMPVVWSTLAASKTRLTGANVNYAPEVISCGISSFPSSLVSVAQVALDTASSSRPHVLRSSGSTCDSSCCKLCQPTSSTDFQQATKLTTISAYSRASSWSTATIDCHQSPSAFQKAGITGGHLEQHVIEATAVSGGSLASSQSGQGMHHDGDLRELDSRKRRAREDSATEAEAADDFVTVERADLSQSHASSSNLILQDSMEFPKRRCIVQPANSEDGSCGDQTGLDSVRWPSLSFLPV